MTGPFKGDEPCTQVPPVMFDMECVFIKWEVEALKKVCAPCDVREACGDYAIENNLSGFWGGMTLAERNKLKQNRRRESKCQSM